MDLLEKLRSEEQSRRDAIEQQHESASRRYREILQRHERPSPGDADALVKAAATLGLISDDVAEDLEALRSVRDISATLLNDEQVEKMWANVQKVHSEVEREMKKYIADAVDGFAESSAEKLLAAVKTIDALRGGAVTSYRDWTERSASAYRQCENSIRDDKARRQRIDQLREDHPRVF